MIHKQKCLKKVRNIEGYLSFDSTIDLQLLNHFMNEDISREEFNDI